MSVGPTSSVINAFDRFCSVVPTSFPTGSSAKETILISLLWGKEDKPS